MKLRARTVCGAALVLGVGLAVAGCSDASKVTIHKPGVYKGPKDPLVEKQGTAEQQDTLRARFNQVQTDR